MTTTIDPTPVAPTPTRALERSRGRRRKPPSWFVHVPFALVVLVAAVPRLVAIFGYQPLLFFYGDSYAYLLGAQDAEPAATRPYGYSVFLRLMAWTGWPPAVAIVQHVTILVLGILLYRWLLRRGAPVWLAVVVPTPMLLDGYQILTEHAALTETLFVTLIIGSALIVMRERLSPTAAAVAGAMLASTALTRTVAVPLVALFIAYLVIRRVGWRPVVAFIVAFSVPLLGYAAWYQSARDVFALQQDGRFLYARVAPIADCDRLQLEPPTSALCEPTIPATRPSPNFYAWDRRSPLFTATLPPDVDRQAVARDFARAVIQGQPLDYARTVAGDAVQYFGPGRSYTIQDTPPSWWNFPETPAAPRQQLALSGSDFTNNSTTVVLDADAAEFLRTWQRTLGTQGPIMLLGLLAALLGALRGRSRPGGVHRIDSLFLVGLGAGLLVLASATSVFDYRYGIPAAPLLYLAGGVGLIALRQRRLPVAAPTTPPNGVPSTPPSTVPNAAVAPVVLDVDHRPRSRAASRSRRLRVQGRPAAALMAVSVVIVVIAVAAAPIDSHPIYGRYVATGAERGTLGYPVSDELVVPDQANWLERRFVGGRIYQSPIGRTYVLGDAAVQGYLTKGGPAVVGMPTSSTRLFTTSPGESVTWFNEAAIAVSQARGIRLVAPPLLTAWCVPKEPCKLGVPLSDVQVADDGTLLQQFERGVLIRRPGERVETIVVPARDRLAQRDAVDDDDQRPAIG